MAGFFIKTWICPKCAYQQDFEPTDENMHNVFNDHKTDGGICPSCFSDKLEKAKLAKDKMIMETTKTGNGLQKLKDKYEDKI